MNSLLRKSWNGLIGPMLRRPPVVQLGALCWRHGKKGIEVLLVTSSQGRWILPKGWPIKGKTGSQTALQEAWEEAGVKRSRGKPDPMGGYDCVKRLDTGAEVPCRIAVYAVEVAKTAKSYPEDDMRKRRWVSVDKAQTMVSDDGLRGILANFSR